MENLLTDLNKSYSNCADAIQDTQEQQPVQLMMTLPRAYPNFPQDSINNTTADLW